MGITDLLVMALVLACSGIPNGETYGFKYWRNPSPVNEYLATGALGKLCAFVATITFSGKHRSDIAPADNQQQQTVFAFTFAPELFVVIGGETESPRRNLLKAGRRYFYRPILFYVFSALSISYIVSSCNTHIISKQKGAGSSP